MAIRTAVVSQPTKGAVKLVTWSGLQASDEGSSFDTADYADRTFSVTGTWNGATCVLKGSNDGSTWFTLKDPFNAAISFTADGMATVMENPVYVKPSNSGGGGSTSLAAQLSCAGHRR